MIIKDYAALTGIRKDNPNKTIIFCSGTFDLTHAGHILFFEDCKKQGDILVVGVGDDDTIHEYKGKTRPILNENVRLKSIDSLKPVDYTVLQKNIKEKPKPYGILWVLMPILEKLRPDKWIVNDDSFGYEERKKMANEYGIELVILDRWCPKEFENISTSNIIKKIKEG